MNKIQSRDYTIKEKGTLRPTELGKVIARLLEDNFPMIMDVGFTAAMEDDLDSIAVYHRDWKELIRLFWDHFIPTVEAPAQGAHVPKELTDLDCPICKHKLEKIWSRQKWFFGCSRCPECKYTTSEEARSFKKEDYNSDFNWEQPCPLSQGPTKLRFGPFLGCTKYPDCKGIINIPRKGEELPEHLPPCPAIGCDGRLSQRRSRFGKPFFSCSNYTDCDVIVNNLDQLAEKYPSHPKTLYVKKAKKGAPGKKGAQKSYSLSPELQDIVAPPPSLVPKSPKLSGSISKSTTSRTPKTEGSSCRMLNLPSSLDPRNQWI